MIELGSQVLIANGNLITIGVISALSTRLQKGGKEKKSFTVLYRRNGIGAGNITAELEEDFPEDAICEITSWNTSDQAEFVRKNAGQDWAQSKSKELTEPAEETPITPAAVLPKIADKDIPF